MLYRTALSVPWFKVIFSTLSSNFLILSIDLPAIRNPRSSINKRQITFGTCISISTNSPLIYIRKKIEDTSNPYDILVAILHLGFMNPLIISSTYVSIRKDCIHLIRLSSISRLAIFGLAWLIKHNQMRL